MTKGTFSLHNEEGVAEAYHLKAALIRILSDHGVKATGPTVGDLAGYITKLVNEVTYRSSTAAGAASAIAKEIWDEPIGPRDTHRRVHR